MTCKECRGLLVIESTASIHPICVGIEIPVDGCKRCQSEGYKIYEKAVKSKQYISVQLTDRVKKVYQRVKDPNY
jgi:hypothetical protein